MQRAGTLAVAEATTAAAITSRSQHRRRRRAAPAAASPTIDYDELQRLGELHTNGTLTDEEFAAAKAKVLGT